MILSDTFPALRYPPNFGSTSKWSTITRNPSMYCTNGLPSPYTLCTAAENKVSSHSAWLSRGSTPMIVSASVFQLCWISPVMRNLISPGSIAYLFIQPSFISCIWLLPSVMEATKHLAQFDACLPPWSCRLSWAAGDKLGNYICLHIKFCPISQIAVRRTTNTHCWLGARW